MDVKEKSEMKPWEQHSSVISIPRFDYNAPTSLLHSSFSGFLITCPFNREKSATKEAMAILEKCMGSCSTSTSVDTDISESPDKNVSAKRRKLCVVEVDAECTDGTVAKDSCLSPVKADGNIERNEVLSLVKLTRSGLLLLTFPRDTSLNVVRIVSNIISSLDSGSLKTPLWCHRFFPIQATCTLTEKELSQAVSNLVTQFIKDETNKLARPLKFAIGFNKRGVEEAEIKGTKVCSTDSDAFALLDRNKCFRVVAGAVKDVIPDSVVDLKSPEMSILVELLPISQVTISNKAPVVGISVLPYNLVNVKPRLSVKALASDAKK